MIELYLNRSIAENALGSNIHMVALDSLADSYQESDMSDELYDAIRFCLVPIPDRRSRTFSFHDAGFREKYYHEVIARLERDLDANFDVDWQEIRIW